MSTLDDQLSNLFGLSPSEVKTEIVEIKKDVRDVTIAAGDKLLSDEDLMADIRRVQSSIRKIMDAGVEAIEEAAKTAKTSQDPDAYNALGSLIKSMTDLNMSAIELHERARSIDADRANAEESQVRTGDMIQNNTFIGTSADLIKQLTQSIGGRGLDAAAAVITVEIDAPGLHTGKTEIGRSNDE